MLHSNDNRIKKYCRINDKSISPFLTDVFEDQNFERTNNKSECDLFIPTTEDEIKMLKFPKNTIVSTIDNINHLNRKHKLWNNLVNKYGNKTASLIIPPTFNILKKDQLKNFAVDYLNTRGSYILKNEQESARGILVSNNLNNITQHIIDKKNVGFPVTVIQRLVKSFLIHDRVFKIRMFLLIKCDKETGLKHFYLHNLGGIFYAPEAYNLNNLNNNNIIANGYWYNTITHSDYLGFINDKPKNMKELYEYIRKEGVDPKKIMIKIINLLILIFKSIEDKIYTKNYQYDQFCILGFDIMIDENFKPWIIEFNKGPSTSNYDDVNVYDSKKKVWNDIYNLVQNKPNNFQEIYRS